MPTDKPRITFTLDEDTLAAIDDYKFKHRIKNQSQAILTLIEKGMCSLAADQPQIKNSPTSADAEERMSLEDSTAMLVELGYIRPGEQLSDADLAFFEHIVGLMDSWFDSKKP